MSRNGQQSPKTWENLTFEQAIEPITDEGKRVDRSDYLSEGFLPVIDQGEEFIGGYTNDSSKRYNGPLPVIVFGDHTRRVKLVDFPFVVGAQGVKLLRPKDCWEPRFLAYLLPTLSLPDRGYGRHYQYLRQLKFSCPPRPFQRQIVAEIEKQFTRLEAGVSGLRRVQANLKRYRAAVLKAACEGKLVPTDAELARQERRSYETGAQLLDRILTERHQKWNGKGKYQEPEKPDITTLPPLPRGWTWASLDQLQKLLRNGISKKPDAERGLPILRISAVRALSVNLSDTRYLKAQPNDYAEFRLSKGDLLFTRYNGNPDLVGVCGVVPDLASDLVHPDKLIRCKLASDELLPKFAGIMANIGASREFLVKRVRTTAGQAGISGGDLKALPIPVAPVTEQQRIVAEVERRLSVVEELEAVVNANLQRTTRLRQAILQQAFEGRLVNGEN